MAITSPLDNILAFGQPTISQCGQHNWGYLIILKQGRIPTLFNKAVEAKESTIPIFHSLLLVNI
jgi:hypothetical protein